MSFLKRFGIDTYMLLLIGVVILGAALPVSGVAAQILGKVTYWAVALLFFIYGAKLDLDAVKAGIMNLRLQSLSFLATYVMFPLVGIALAWVFGGILGPDLALGLVFLSVLPSTIQSSIAFTAMAHGNVPAAICSASLSNLVAVVLTPALMALVLHQSGGISMDAVTKIATQILLPFVLGQLLRRWIGPTIQRHKAITMVVDRGSILLIVYSAFSASTVAGLWSSVPPLQLLSIAVVIGLYVALMMTLTHFAGMRSGLSQPDRTTLFFCGSTKSLASGLPIATALFAADRVGMIVLPLMLFHLLQLLACAIIAQRLAFRLTSAPLPQRHG